MALKKDNRFAWGLTLLIFGCLFLVRQLHILPSDVQIILFDFKNYPLLMGIIFLLSHNNKSIGIILIIVAILFRISDIILWTKNVSDFIWPILLIIAGAIMVFGKIKK